ncbi:hypothetical protein [Streptomyces capitiformicae]|uniref:Uncharacterized protein n=1 Tax=Streptomyces capitiformicae TaxID=2014920 RepID=A0A919GQH1_9ACTN|nr:hypothetical protein [Streptomyces capitiformicae]GHH88862.1 hypothetical protein GCM10017771_35970 [Streptomyces capitiformicae]
MAAPWDVIVVGGGNAGPLRRTVRPAGGAQVLVLEKAPRQWAGGNSSFIAGAMRTSHGGLADLKDLLEPAAQDRFPLTGLAPYAEATSSTKCGLTAPRCSPNGPR